MLLQWLSRILVRKKAERPNRIITLDDAESRIEILKRDSERYVNDICKGISSEVKKLEQEIRVSLDRLQNASLQNPNIPVRHEQIMEGNRRAYINAVNRFLEKIKESFPEPNSKTSLKSIHGFFEKTEAEFSHLRKSMHKQLMVMHEFLEDECRAVQMRVGELEKTINDVKADEKIKIIENAAKAERALNEIKHKIHAQKNLKSDIDRIDNKLDELDTQKEKLLNELEKLELSNEYLTFSSSNSRLEELKARFQTETASFGAAFSPIQGVLKRFPTLAPANIPEYVTNPAGAIVMDENFEIIDTMQLIERELERSDIKPLRKKKAAEAMMFFDKQRLWHWRIRLAELINEIKSTEEELRKSTIAKRIEEKKKEIEAAEELIYSTRQAAMKMKEEDFKQEIEELSAKLSELLSAEEKIVVKADD